MTRDAFEARVPLLIGTMSTVVMQGWTGWWLNSGTGVAWTLAMLFLCAALVGSRAGRSLWAGPLALWVGSMTGLTIGLFWLGPGTIWPIVLLVSSVLTAGTIVAGIGVGRVCEWLSDVT
jgi:hypothetical protein